ncbi:uncharacterized protein At1g66480-like [Zingiber officinale]|uniref:uncharacterized protein At1g66480-like n=1 Tax=Zingiber officinale TaxID=94328 RepID=UPI001C4A7EB0|nr:uncharacterized protein At1g66480-like [Zingiber officinale]
MGNSLGGRKKMAKVMKVDGSTFKVKPPAQAAGVLRDYPSHALLDAEKVHRLGLRARPLDPDAPLKPGRLYFLVELRHPRHRAGSGGSRRAWSGELGQSGARERLESLRLSRRSASDVSSRSGIACAPATVTGAKDDGTLRIKMRLPKAQVEKLMEETAGDAAEVAQRIMQLCAVEDKDGATSRPTLLSAPPPAAPSSLSASRKEKRTRFLATPQEIMV